MQAQHFCFTLHSKYPFQFNSIKHEMAYFQPYIQALCFLLPCHLVLYHMLPAQKGSLIVNDR